MKKVIYTAIIGNRDIITEPAYIPEGFDFICFTNQDLRSKVWDVRKVSQTLEDPTRNARMYKLLPHRFLGGYDVSVWLDGNMRVVGDIQEIIDIYLNKVPIAVFDHAQNKPDSINCVYKEAEHLLGMYERGKKKEDPDLIRKQVGSYLSEEYPVNNGLAVTQLIARKHNDEQVQEAMELWWSEMKRHTKRDQLSFNYALWKTQTPFVFIEGDSRKNQYVQWTKHVG